MHQPRHDADLYRRVELITGGRRRRDWTNEEKARIVAESMWTRMTALDTLRSTSALFPTSIRMKISDVNQDENRDGGWRAEGLA
jgi:hypothetical protein